MKEALIGFSGTILGVGLTLVYQWFTFKIQRKDQFRLAALDKRLEKHQEAFSLWREILSVVHDRKERSEIVYKCQEWWFKNCLYLQSEARSAFWEAFQNASNYDPKYKDMVENSWPKIENAGEIIAASVGLPAIGDMQDIMKKIDQEKSAK